MFDARAWLESWFAAYPWHDTAERAGDVLLQIALEQPTNARVALHTEAVSRLPALRAASDDPHAWHKGSALYQLVCCLYEEQLPYTEEDVLALLESSEHDCGHGADVKAPFEAAVAWARVHGVTPAWLAAVRTFNFETTSHPGHPVSAPHGSGSCFTWARRRARGYPTVMTFKPAP